MTVAQGGDVVEVVPVTTNELSALAVPSWTETCADDSGTQRLILDASDPARGTI